MAAVAVRVSREQAALSAPWPRNSTPGQDKSTLTASTLTSGQLVEHHHLKARCFSPLQQEQRPLNILPGLYSKCRGLPVDDRCCCCAMQPYASHVATFPVYLPIAELTHACSIGRHGPLWRAPVAEKPGHKHAFSPEYKTESCDRAASSCMGVRMHQRSPRPLQDQGVEVSAGSDRCPHQPVPIPWLLLSRQPAGSLSRKNVQAIHTSTPRPFGLPAPVLHENAVCLALASLRHCICRQWLCTGAVMMHTVPESGAQHCNTNSCLRVVLRWSSVPSMCIYEPLSLF